ncbi:MAG: EamA family transporter [Phycisphaerales bacterium]
MITGFCYTSPPMFMFGLILGVGTAVSQSFAYLFSRILAQRGWSMVRLLILSHVIMGLIALPLMLLFWNDQFLAWRTWFWPLMGASAFYVLGQTSFLTALRFTQPSRVAPLLGLKIVILASIAAVWLNLPLNTLQWIAVILATVAAFLLNYTGGANPPRTVIAVLAACLFYALSDTCIVFLIRAMQAGDSHLLASVRAVTLAYLFCGLIALPPAIRMKPAWRDWRSATPYSLAWLGSMACLFGAISIINVVLTNILQSLRGLVSIGLGVWVARAGHHHLESHTPRAVLVRRVIAAAMMTAAVGLYVWPTGGK